jgi:phage repressor protein C with HTH and peptisase S24 domain
MAPVHSWVSAGRAHDYQDMQDFIDEQVPTTHRDPHVFALVVEGDSMEPMFPAGDYIILAPHSEPRSGDLVVARLRESEGVLFKEYRVRPDGTVALISYNPKYPEQIFRKTDLLYVYQVVGRYTNTVR